MRKFDPITETSYLNVPNSYRYRQIMRIFFLEYEKIRYQLYKEDVFEIIKNHEGFSDYSMDQLISDLGALVEYKNLIPIQDTKRVSTIEEYRNKQYRYSMSEYAVEIERLTLRLENLFLEQGGISTNMFVRIHESLLGMEKITTQPLKKVNEWWNSLQEDFRRLNQSYMDYLSEFYSGRSEAILKSLEFLMYKDKFIKYLNEFIEELRVNSISIERTLYKMEPIQKKLLELVVKSQMDIPRYLSDVQPATEEAIRSKVYESWQSLVKWFCSEGGVSEATNVLDKTNEIISNIVFNASLIAQLHNSGLSRKNDYRHFVDLFLGCEEIEDAHKLSAHLFGIQGIRHYRVNAQRQTDDINSSTFDEIPMTFEVKSHSREFRGTTKTLGIQINELEKEAAKNQYIQQMKKERELIDRYIIDNRLEIDKINEIISENTRNIIFRWIGIANTNMNEERISLGVTEYGRSFEARREGTYTKLNCEDGDIVMPNYIFEFKE